MSDILSKPCCWPRKSESIYGRPVNTVFLTFDDVVNRRSIIPRVFCVRYFQSAYRESSGLSATIDVKNICYYWNVQWPFNNVGVDRADPRTLICSQRSASGFSLFFRSLPLSFSGGGEIGVARDEFVILRDPRFHFRQLATNVNYVNDRRQRDDDSGTSRNSPTMPVERVSEPFDRAIYKGLSILLDLLPFPLGLLVLAWRGGAILT